MITGIGTSSVALAVRKIAQEKGKIDINTGAGLGRPHGPACSETGAHWVYDTYCAGQGDGRRHRQGRRRFLVLPHRRLRLRPCAGARRDAVGDGVGRQGAGRRRHPLSTQDFSSFLLQAQASKAKIIGLANAGQDTINSIKQAGEFGIVKGGQSSPACSSSRPT
jgi:branched-chain amino acid transport system substrate-binding protein